MPELALSKFCRSLAYVSLENSNGVPLLETGGRCPKADTPETLSGPERTKEVAEQSPS